MKVKQEIKELKKNKYNHELEMALKLKEKLQKENEIIELNKKKQKEEKETNNLFISSSTESLKRRYLQEAKKRVLSDLFS